VLSVWNAAVAVAAAAVVDGMLSVAAVVVVCYQCETLLL
jgi:hypothetical protein